MTTAIDKPKPQNLRQQLAGDYFKQQVALALPKHMTPDRFVRVGLTALMKTPKLMECTPESVIQCMLNCSALGLEPDGRRAHLIPYKTTCTLIVDYKGLVELAKRSGDVSGVFAQTVCENDHFEWENGEVTHKIDFRRERGQMYAAYATVTFKDGTKQSDVMTLAEINAVRKRSRAGGEGPWVTDYAEMAKKTVFRRLSKWLTLSPEVADALDKVEPTIAPQVLVETVSQSVAAAESEALDVPSVAQVTDSEPDDVPGAEAPTPKAAPKAAAPAAPVPVTLAADTIQRTVQQHLAEVVENAGFTFGDFVKWAGESGNIQDADSLTGWPEVDPTVARRLIRAEKGLIAGIKQAKGVAQ